MSSRKRHKNLESLANAVGIEPARVLQAEIKANLTAALIKEVEKRQLTHEEVAESAGVARTSVTGIINGSLFAPTALPTARGPLPSSRAISP